MKRRGNVRQTGRWNGWGASKKDKELRLESAGQGGALTAANAEARLRMRVVLGDPRDLSAYQDCIDGARRSGAALRASNGAPVPGPRKYMIGPGGKLVVR